MLSKENIKEKYFILSTTNTHNKYICSTSVQHSFFPSGMNEKETKYFSLISLNSSKFIESEDSFRVKTSSFHFETFHCKGDHLRLQ